MPTNRKEARSHQESCAALCAVCSRKVNGMRNISPAMADLIRTYAIPEYDRDSGLHPTVICPADRQALTAYKRLGPNQTSHLLQPLLDYSRLVTAELGEGGKVQYWARDCVCGVCQLARTAFVDQITHNQAHTNPVPSLQTLEERARAMEERAEAQGNTPNLNTSSFTCDYCLSELTPGEEHTCTLNDRRHNVVDKLKKMSDTTLTTAANHTLREIARRQAANMRGGTVDLKSGFGGPDLQVKVGTSRDRHPAAHRNRYG